MKPMRSKINYLTVAVALVCIHLMTGEHLSCVQAQDIQTDKKTMEVAVQPIELPSRQRQLQKRIIEVLDSIADRAQKWDDRVVVARTEAQIADLIWDANPDNAKRYLQVAWAAAAKVEEPTRDLSTFINPSLRNAVRRDVLLIARKRAPELATRWLEEMLEESKSADQKGRGTFDDRSARSAVLLQMANELVVDNPRAAAELLMESLADGISFNFQGILIRIQANDSALAETVFRAGLGRLRAAGMKDPNELLSLYAYLFTPGRVHGANTSDNRNQVQLAIGGARVAVPAGRQNPRLALEFLEIASDLLLSTSLPDSNDAQGIARSLVSVIGIILREITSLMPEKAALLRARAQQLDSDARFSNAPIDRSPDIPEVRQAESKEAFAKRREDLLEEVAAKGRDVLTRDIGYAKAAVATSVERYERGLGLASKIDNKNLRVDVRNWLLFRTVLHFIASGNLDEALRLNLLNDDADQRAVCFVVGAQRLAKDKETVRASEWLHEAGAIVRRNEPNESLARVAFGIVSTFGQFDSQASLNWLLNAVKLMGKIRLTSLNDDKAPSIRRISGITPIRSLTAETSGFSLQAAVAVFPPDQFEDVLYILNNVTPQEARGIAVVTYSRYALTTFASGTKKVGQRLP